MNLWRKIPGFSDYEVSDSGEIRSLERTRVYKSGRIMSLKEKPKKLRKHPQNGFMMTDLIDDLGNRKTVYPHKAVALAYVINPKPRKQKVVMHKDGNILNNTIDNLRWATFSESIKKGFESGKRDNSNLWEKRREKYGEKGGLKPMGRPNPVSEEDKKMMIYLRTTQKFTLKQLSEKFSCSISHAHKTLREYELNKAS
jgi:hypothetical protein